MPLVSIIMNCYNSDKYLKEALDSVYRQTFRDYEIIFWDNQSTDKSPEIAKSYGDPLRYFRGESFLPLGGGRTMAVRQARGKYITFLDCDDMWLPDKLEKQVRIMEENPDISFLYSNYFIQKPNCKYVALSGKQPEGYVFETFLYNFNAATLTVMLRRELLEQLDSYFEENLSFAMDYDVFMRYLYNRKARYIDEPLAVYRVHSSSISSKRVADNVNEVKYVLDKLKKLNSEIEIKYADAIRLAQRNQEFAFAWSEMKQGNFKEARRVLGPYKMDRPMYLIHYIGTFMPVSVWRFSCSVWFRLKSLYTSLAIGDRWET